MISIYKQKRLEEAFIKVRRKIIILLMKYSKKVFSIYIATHGITVFDIIVGMQYLRVILCRNVKRSCNICLNI